MKQVTALERLLSIGLDAVYPIAQDHSGGRSGGANGERWEFCKGTSRPECKIERERFPPTSSGECWIAYKACGYAVARVCGYAGMQICGQEIY